MSKYSAEDGDDSGYFAAQRLSELSRLSDECAAWRRQAEKAEARYTKVLLETNWRPIATAPTDGTKILLAKIVGHPSHETALWWVARGFWSEKWNNWNDGVEPSGLAGPTHWLPANGYGIPLSSLAE